MVRLSVLSPALILTAGVAAGAAMDATIKHLAHTNHVLLVVLGRYVFGTLFALAIWAQAGRPRITPGMVRAHGLRGLVVAACSTSFFWGLTVLPLAEAVTLTFIYPLVVPFAAWAMIGERVRLASMASAGLGFIGVLIAALGGPDAAVSPLHAWGVASVLFSALTFAIAMVILRARAQTDGAAIVGLMASLMPGLLIAAPAIALSPPPLWSDWPIFLLMGAFAATLTYLTARAYALAEAQLLAPIHYTELIWAALFGFAIFHETPRPQVLLGAILIIGASLFSAYEERRATLQPKDAT